MVRLASLAPTRSALAMLALLAVCLVAAPAIAQVGPVNPQVSLDLSPAPVGLGAGNTTTLAATVTNPGRFDGAVVLAFAVPDGWTATVEPDRFPLAAGASQPVAITLVAPAAGAGAATGSLALDATLTDAAGRAAAASASAPLTRVDPFLPPPPAPWYQQPLGMAVIAASVLLAASGSAFAARRSKQARLAAEDAARAAAEQAAHEAWLARETGVTLRVLDGPHAFGNRRETIYRVEVANVSDRPRVAVLSVAERDEGFRAAVSLPHLPLSPGERTTVSVYVTPEPSARPGTTGRVVLSARPEEAQERDERVTLDVVAPAPRTPATHGSRPLVAPRERIPLGRNGDN